MKVRFFCLIFFFAVGFVGCSGNKKSPAYSHQLHHWTRAKEQFQKDLHFVSVKVHATLLSQDMILAQANEVAQIYASDVEQQKYLEQTLTETRETLTFFVSFYGYDRKYADLSRVNSSWKVYLDDRGVSLDPLKIEKIRYLTPLQRRLYPYVDTWSSFYFVTFAKNGNAAYRDLTLSIRGPDGRADLSWP
jgi:hypothetical protein